MSTPTRTPCTSRCLTVRWVGNWPIKEFRTDAGGYREAIRFMTGQGRVQSVGVEGTSSYGARPPEGGHAPLGLDVIEVNRPDRAARRRRGKSDPLDAYQAARAVLSGRATTAPPRTRAIEALRALHNARRSAVKARTAAMQPDPPAADHRPRPTPREVPGSERRKRLIDALARCRPPRHDPVAAAS